MTNGIYLSGAVTGAEGYEERFQSAEDKIRELYPGKPIFNPVKFIEGYPMMSYETCMQICINALDYCDTICMLSDWKASKGANREYGYALASDKKILFYDDIEEEEASEGWIPVSKKLPEKSDAYLIKIKE